jgi:hypothetical protein
MPGCEKDQPPAAVRPANAQLPASLGFELGRRFACLCSRRLIAAAAIVAFASALDFAVGRYQQYRLQQRRLADLRLQHAALYVEVMNVAYEPDQKSYRLTMKFTNDEPGRPLYLM